jgi:hypothetical protein
VHVHGEGGGGASSLGTVSWLLKQIAMIIYCSIHVQPVPTFLICLSEILTTKKTEKLYPSPIVPNVFQNVSKKPHINSLSSSTSGYQTDGTLAFWHWNLAFKF